MVYLQTTYELCFGGNVVFWIFWIVWFFPRKYKYRCVRVYVWFKDDKHVIWMWIWLTLKKYQPARQNMKLMTSLTRHRSSYSGSAGWYFRYQSIHIHIQITYTCTFCLTDMLSLLNFVEYTKFVLRTNPLQKVYYIRKLNLLIVLFNLFWSITTTTYCILNR